jgi:hypothetical protein
MVARDGIAQHYTPLSIPLTGVYLYPAQRHLWIGMRKPPML